MYSTCMKQDSYGQFILSEEDLCKHYLQNPDLPIKEALVNDNIVFHDDLNLQNYPILQTYKQEEITIVSFDERSQKTYWMPQSYYDLDIAEWVLLSCNNEEAPLQRCGAELLRYVELDLLPLLQYLKYLVDTLRLNNIVWGVGRGSSVSSYVLYKIGVHKIDSLYYGLDYKEFLK